MFSFGFNLRSQCFSFLRTIKFVFFIIKCFTNKTFTKTIIHFIEGISFTDIRKVFTNKSTTNYSQFYESILK